MVLLNGVEVGEIAQMSEFYHGNVHLVFLGVALFFVKHHAVFVIHTDVFEIWHYTKYRHLA